MTSASTAVSSVAQPLQHIEQKKNSQEEKVLDRRIGDVTRKRIQTLVEKAQRDTFNVPSLKQNQNDAPIDASVSLAPLLSSGTPMRSPIPSQRRITKEKWPNLMRRLGPTSRSAQTSFPNLPVAKPDPVSVLQKISTLLQKPDLYNTEDGPLIQKLSRYLTDLETNHKAIAADLLKETGKGGFLLKANLVQNQKAIANALLAVR
jgi:hypothetical protein